MSTQDNNPASDNVREVFPVQFFDGRDDSDGTDDWRPKPIPASAPEVVEEAPKAESAPEPASSSESLTVIEEPVPVPPVLLPAAKAPGPSKVPAPGKQAS